VVSLPQGVAALPTVTSASAGLAPASGGGTTNFLRADGSWAAPAGGGGGTPVVPIPYKAATGNWLTNSANTTTLTTSAGVAGRIEIAPFLMPYAGSFNQVGVLCSTAVASAQGKVVCYSSDVDGRPSTLVFESGVLDFGTVGFKSIAQTFTAQAGALYWFGLRQSSTATVNAHQPYCSPVLAFPAVPTTAASKLLRRTLSFTTASPASWGYIATEETASNVPAIFLRAA
jgi:hypothetical protein